MGRVVLFLLKSIAWVFFLSPWPLKRASAALLGALLRTLRLRARIVNQNLDQAYPGATERERRDLYRAAYTHLGFLTFEIFMLFGPMTRFTRKYAELRGLEHWQEAKRRGKGVIFLAGHVGNWEIMGATGTLLGGMDVLMVTKHLKPEWFHRAIEQGRARYGVAATYEPRTLRDVLAHLKRNGTLGMVQDQYAGPPVGVRVPFFGVPVGTMTALATLVRRTGATVLPAVNYRSRNGRWVTEISGPLGWLEAGEGTPEERAHQEIAMNTAHYASIMEQHIRAHPEQWLWIHRRFKGDLSPLRADEWKEARVRH